MLHQVDVPVASAKLNDTNWQSWSRKVVDLCDHIYGDIGMSISLGIEHLMEPLPTEDDTDKAGRRVYRHISPDNPTLSTRDYTAFREDLKRMQNIHDKRKIDDEDCITFLFSITNQLIRNP